LRILYDKTQQEQQMMTIEVVRPKVTMQSEQVLRKSVLKRKKVLLLA